MQSSEPTAAQTSAHQTELEIQAAAAHAAYVGSAVTAIAVLRGELYGRLEG